MHCSVGDGELTCATCRTASKNVGPGPALGGIQVGPTSIALAGCTSFSNDDGKLKCDDPT